MPATGLADRRSTASDAGPVPSGARAEPERTCVGCRRRGSRSSLLRVVVAPDEAGNLLVDVRRRLPGRGAWLHESPACLELAEKRRAWSRALRRPAPLDASGVRSFLDTCSPEDVVPTTTDESGSNS
ncbi:YlxR family protein [Kineococcus sp. SYSU DK003]|uniref:YlxR family protein n=1 Tax=Kineococcus sp. SYSU DK003 TaxID=3383124 RepID=UPI003D7C8A67